MGEELGAAQKTQEEVATAALTWTVDQSNGNRALQKGLSIGRGIPKSSTKQRCRGWGEDYCERQGSQTRAPMRMPKGSKRRKKI